MLKRCPTCHCLFDTTSVKKIYCCRFHAPPKPHRRYVKSYSQIKRQSELRFDNLIKLQEHAFQLGMSFGKYLGYLQLGLNPADFVKAI